jgi:hypothetical protein
MWKLVVKIVDIGGLVDLHSLNFIFVIAYYFINLWIRPYYVTFTFRSNIYNAIPVL